MIMKLTIPIALAFFIASAKPVAAVDADEPHQIVDKAVITIAALLGDENYGNILAVALNNAHGVVIVPSLIKVGFIVGRGGGSGVLLARTADGGWSSPAFVTLGQASIGLQIGGSVSEVMLVVNTVKGLNSILHRKVTLGVDIEIAVGHMGAGLGAQTTVERGADVWTFSHSSGLIMGAAFDGTYIEPRDDWNFIYYGQRVSSKDIATNPNIVNSHAQSLRDALAKRQ